MPSESVREKILAAADLIERPEHWTQRAYARDNHGSAINSNSEYAVQWCALGALAKSGLDVAEQLDISMDFDRKFGEDLGSYNDYSGRTSHQVASALRGIANS